VHSTENHLLCLHTIVYFLFFNYFYAIYCNNNNNNNCLSRLKHKLQTVTQCDRFSAFWTRPNGDRTATRKTRTDEEQRTQGGSKFPIPNTSVLLMLVVKWWSCRVHRLTGEDRAGRGAFHLSVGATGTARTNTSGFGQAPDPRRGQISPRQTSTISCPDDPNRCPKPFTLPLPSFFHPSSAPLLSTASTSTPLATVATPQFPVGDFLCITETEWTFLTTSNKRPRLAIGLYYPLTA